MNKIEQQFFDTWNDYSVRYEQDENYDIDPYPEFGLECQKPIGIYIPDFIMGTCIIEIDGQEAHKTKEQRYNDCVRERFFIKQGYTVIRFTASEVYVDPLKCVLEMLAISNKIEERERNIFFMERELKACKESK